MLKKAIDFAERSLEWYQSDDRKHALSYFSIYVLASGIIEDLDESLAQLMRAINLPISIYIVQMQPNSEDLAIDKL